ncbi:SCO family protein [Modicisalibacter luteus]|uniref:SCO family protein n=1 Tax=Modicisalibacter luteus TaxID=453962 RepID=A0ABV7LZ86_9GAMM|nr:SCO family protein [Halomonas lutea]GHA96272.1 cytochrome-c oxidase [Halomonas lutea]
MSQKRCFPLFALFIFVSSPLLAHSLQDAEKAIQKQENYVQFVDRPAPEFSLADSRGNIVSLTNFQDKVVVLNFIYTRCANACPLHMNLLAEVQDQISDADLQDNVEFITVATDTEDTEGTRTRLQAYVKNFELEPANWHFLYRNETEIAGTTRQIAESYGLRFDPVADGVQAHGVVTHVIDQSGQMRARFHGLKFEPEHLVSYAKVLVKGPDSLSYGVWDKVRHYLENMSISLSS